jgi:serine/threonine protein kinase
MDCQPSKQFQFDSSTTASPSEFQRNKNRELMSQLSGMILNHVGESSFPSPASGPNPPMTLGKYQLLREIGRGGTAIVFEARDTVLERLVAVKLLLLDLADSTARERLLGEACAAVRLNHPNTVAVYDVGEDASGLFIAMELIHGASAQAGLEQNGPFPWIAATQIAIEVCQGLAAAHAAGLIHRDIKPANIMLVDHSPPAKTSRITASNPEGTTEVDRSPVSSTAKLADFGLSRSLNYATNITLNGQVAGTPNYMSPEQIRSERLDERTDIYSLGATYFTLLTGRYAFVRDGVIQTLFAHCSAAIPDPRQWNPALPPECSLIITRAMAKEPRDRYRSVEELLADLRSLLLSQAGIKPPQTNGTSNSQPAASQDSNNKVTVGQSEAASRRRVHVLRKHFLRYNSLPAVAVCLVTIIGGILTFVYQPVLQTSKQTTEEFTGVFADETKVATNSQPPSVTTRAPRPALPSTGMRIDQVWGADRDGDIHVSGSMELMRLRLSHDGRTLVWGTSEGPQHHGRLTLFDLARREVVGMYLDQTSYASFNCLAFTPVERYVLLACSNRVIAYNRDTQVVTTLVQFTDGSAESIDVSADGKRLVISVYQYVGGGRVELYDLILDNGLPRVASPRRLHADFQQPVKCVIFSGDGEYLASAGTDGTVLLSDMRQGLKTLKLQLPELQSEKEGIGHTVLFSPDSRLLTAGGRRSVILWDVESGTRRILPEVHRREIMSVAFNVDGRFLATGSTDGIRFWNVSQGTQIGPTLAGHEGTVISGLAFTPNGSFLMSGGYDSRIRFWNLTAPSRKLKAL